MEKKVEIHVRGGLVEIFNKSEGVEVIVKDYDFEDSEPIIETFEADLIIDKGLPKNEPV